MKIDKIALTRAVLRLVTWLAAIAAGFGVIMGVIFGIIKLSDAFGETAVGIVLFFGIVVIPILAVFLIEFYQQECEKRNIQVDKDGKE